MREKMIEVLDSWDCPILLAVCEAEALADYLIENGVTVQKKGKWVDHVCSCCGKVNPTLDMNGWGDYVSKNTNYCSNCGADMRPDAPKDGDT